MKTKLFVVVLFLSTFSFPQWGGFDHYKNFTVTDSNNIIGYLNNYGTLSTQGQQTGFSWSQLNNYQSIVFDQGLWVVGKISGEPVLTMNEWYTTYSPGPIINGQSAMLLHPEDSLRYRIYKINKGDNSVSNPDYLEWPVDFGAPVNPDNSPKIYGDQTHWSVHNGFDPTISGRTLFSATDPILPIPIEVQQLVFLRKGILSDYEDIFSNTIFMEWTIINKGVSTIDSAFIGFWTDIDFESDNLKNFPAIDSTNQLGYCWNNINNASGTTPAVGYTLLYGPVEESAGNSAIYKGGILNNYRNLPLYSFHGVGDDGIDDPLTRIALNAEDAWKFANGMDGNGNAIINPISNLQTRFPFNGDPVSSSGWLFPSPSIGGGAGFVFFTGPFSLAPNDTQWVMVALIPALGRNNLESIELLREKVQLLHSLPYDSLAFGTSNYFITEVDDLTQSIPTEFSLSQNYPNPFNPSTKISWQSPVSGQQTLKVYDVLGNEVATLVDEFRNAGGYEVDFNASSLASGIYFYRLQAGSFIQTKKMILLK